MMIQRYHTLALFLAALHFATETTALRAPTRIKVDSKPIKSVASPPNEAVGALLRVAGPIVFSTMQISSVKTALKIVEDKSVNKLSALPFVALLTNCIVWTLYGILKKDLTVLVPNFTGTVAGLFGTLCFHKFCTVAPTKLYTLSTSIVALAAIFLFRGDATSIGLIGCALAVVLSGSPLATVTTVVREKSTAALPFLNSFTTWLNAFTWLLYGILIAHDIMIYGPNFLGFVLSSMQMLLFAVYGMPPAAVTSYKPNATNTNASEMQPFIG
jgi:uncharacterized protein with PQ loop repeat